VAVIHVEAGLRSFDRAMPEEINRVLTDQISDLLYTTERSALGNLTREGISAERVHFVGNVMIDTLRHNLSRAVPAAETLCAAGAKGAFGKGQFAALTLHRPSNVDHEHSLKRLLETVGEVAKRLPVVFPLHPRTRSRIEQFKLDHLLAQPDIHLLPPQGYLQMLGLMRDARFLFTDSGGIQEETTALGVPCLTLRENTERPITVEEGTNTIVGQSHDAIVSAVNDILATGGKGGRVPEYWDGHAADRIAAHLGPWLASRTPAHARREVAA
jgi:UDP-N-acetylglucosamine 2-epimerase (non-hydrolysing)